MRFKAEVRQQVETAIAERVSAVVLFWGDPEPFVEDAHRSGVKVLIQFGSVQEAKRAADVGVDAVIARFARPGAYRLKALLLVLAPARPLDSVLA
jgi:nitronate monooxygenase